jgi:hypothetical protein
LLWFGREERVRVQVKKNTLSCNACVYHVYVYIKIRGHALALINIGGGDDDDYDEDN